MNKKQRVGARSGRTGTSRWFRLARFGRPARLRPGPVVRGYVLRVVLSVCTVVAATFAVLSIAAVAGPLSDSAPGAASLSRAPAALPPVPVPQGVAAPLPRQPGPTPRPSATRGGDEQSAGQSAPASSAPERQQAYTQWASRVSQSTGIPARALAAYAYAHAVVAEIKPECNMTWVTLAGIARIESNHGRYGGRSLNEAGVPSSPIIGVPLNGSAGNKAIGDTDGGRLDGDPVWDRAVGPFQFIPTTWARWRSDGDGDGVGNPQDIDDSAVAAARYLCASGRDLSTGEGWLQSVLSYNHSMSYANQVYQAAQGYARSVQG